MTQDTKGGKRTSSLRHLHCSDGSDLQARKKEQEALLTDDTQNDCDETVVNLESRLVYYCMSQSHVFRQTSPCLRRSEIRRNNFDWLLAAAAKWRAVWFLLLVTPGFYQSQAAIGFSGVVTKSKKHSSLFYFSSDYSELLLGTCGGLVRL
jgi:hypothetical protein